MPKHEPELPVKAYIGLGANLGNAQVTLLMVINDIKQLTGIDQVTVSGFYKTSPVDAEGPDYVNAVLGCETLLSAHELLDQLLKLENVYGRKRTGYHSPRTLDLDLLVYGDRHIDSSFVTVPHPRMHQRAFVLRPLLDIIPDGFRLAQGSITELLICCSDQRIERLPDLIQP